MRMFCLGAKITDFAPPVCDERTVWTPVDKSILLDFSKSDAKADSGLEPSNVPVESRRVGNVFIFAKANA